jgi:chromosome segregation ATPase
VKGLVAQLFTLDEGYTRAGTALEVCAGGRLYNVVVDNAETGTELLQKGKLKKRVTIIPLNKIDAFKASAQKVGAAQRIAPDKVNLALSLIGYDKEVTRAMEYVFGSTLICDDAETAKQVTFDPAVRLKSVTLEGDVYDPAGTLSGGSAPQSSGVLVTLQKLNGLTKELNEQENKLATLQATMAREKKRLDAARKIKQDLVLKAHEIELTEKQIGGNSSSEVRPQNHSNLLRLTPTDYSTSRDYEERYSHTQSGSQGSQSEARRSVPGHQTYRTRYERIQQQQGRQAERAPVDVRQTEKGTQQKQCRYQTATSGSARGQARFRAVCG